MQPNKFAPRKADHPDGQGGKYEASPACYFAPR